MQFRPAKRTRKHRPRQETRPEDVVPIVEPVMRELYTITLSNPRTGRDCVIALFPGKRPGNLRALVNGEHQPKLATTTELMAWLRAKLPRTSPKRATHDG